MNLADTRKFRILGGILIFVIIIILLYLKNNSYFQSMLMKTLPTSTPTPSAADNIIIPGSKDDKENLINKAKEDLAERLDVIKEEIKVKSTQKKDWPDSSLGCPKPGMMYAQVITPGYLIVLETVGKGYNYHTSQDVVTLCQ